MANSPSTGPVDLWTLGCIANSLQNCGLPCIRSSDNENSELDLWELGGMLLRSHSTKGLWEGRLAKVMIRRWIPLYVINTVQIVSYDYCGVGYAVTLHGSTQPINALAALAARSGVAWTLAWTQRCFMR